MTQTMQERTLTDLLLYLKNRSGCSYTELGHKTFISRSTLQRYCTGESPLPDPETVARIVRACGGNQREQREAFTLWLKETPPQPNPNPNPAPPPNPNPDPAPPPVPDRSRRSTVGRVLAALVLVAVLVLVKASPDDGGAAPVPQWVSGPAWSSAPAQVQPERFGVTINSNTGQMPAFRVGSVRLWDSATRWSLLEPRRGVRDWTVLDRLIDGAHKAGLPALFVFGGTPAWAAPAAARMPYPDGSRAAPPDDLATWESFIKAVASRYRGRIEAYELWSVGNDPRHFAHGPEALLEMTRRGAQALREADPDATVVCPGMGRLWEERGRNFMKRFAELGGYRHCDVAAVKLHQRRAADPPESALEALQTVDDTLHNAGTHPPVWNTGSAHDIVLQRPSDAGQAIDYAVRFYLTGLYGTARNLQRTYFYAWGNTKIPVVLQAVEGEPTGAALAVEHLQRWLQNAKITACGHGRPVRLPKPVWQCKFQIPSSTGSSRPAVIWWTDNGETIMTDAPQSAAMLHRLDGSATSVSDGDSIPVGPRPVLLTSE